MTVIAVLRKVKVFANICGNSYFFVGLFVFAMNNVEMVALFA